MAATSESPMFTIADAMPEMATRKFTLFPRLPIELRHKIWHFAFAQPRIIKVSIYSREQIDECLRLARLPVQGNANNTTYSVVVSPHQIGNKLAHVNKEAQLFARDFYRGRIHFWHITGEPFSQTVKNGFFDFNPEHDFIELENVNCAIGNSVAFISHLKTIYDPRGIGLLNLAVGYDTLRQLRHYDPSADHINFRNTVAEVLNQLQEIFFISSGLPCHQNWYPSHAPEGPNSWSPEFPVCADGAASSFHRLRHDPRDIDQYLWKSLVDGAQFMRRNSMFEAWVAFLGKYSPTPQLLAGQQDHRMLLRKPKFPKNCDREVIENWANQELELSGTMARPGHAAGVKPAFGFWLFPMAVFLRTDGWPEWKDIRPELGLIDLP
ncbi:hypothetical protein F4806DRAFT_79949 [Annulohypoxylon nitens]|nr:hypothetical protein F4806DRAFT_79949 [Annulohypoxylon nitens]